LIEEVKMAPDGSYRVDIPSVKDAVSEEEWQTRVDLACAYRLVSHQGWLHGVANHISMRVPGEAEHFLLNPYGLEYREVTASSLVKIDLDGNKVMDSPFGVNQAGFVIHSAIHAARHDITCALHTHTEAGMAISALKCGLLPLSMSAIRFHNRMSYHDYEGVTLDTDERESIAAHLGPNNYAMILRNHGLLTLGRNIGEAYYLMYNLEKSCRSQLAAMATGAELEIPPEDVLEKSAQQSWQSGNNNTDVHPAWPAFMREMDALDPSYRN
jgi:ribulose-5-phosphate 4-epimerase/fuculose-1-phosphate aldolase